MKLMALGGTDHVGANCYFLSMDGINLLFDCGTGLRGSRLVSPDFDALLRDRNLGISSLAQIDAVLISHGHYDHIGSLPSFLSGAHTRVYATHQTIALMDNLLMDRQSFYHENDTLFKRFGRETQQIKAIQHIQPVSFGKAFQIGPLKITFCEAGHVPGAAMIYVEGSSETFLYTGDFSMQNTQLTTKAHIPSSLHPQTVLLCGLHAKHPYYSPHNRLHRLTAQVEFCLSRGQSVYIHMKHLTKGLETAHYIANLHPNTPIYLEDAIWELAEKLCLSHLPAQHPNFFPASGWNQKQSRPSIHVGSRPGTVPIENIVTGDFSLHAAYSDCLSLLHRLDPENIFVVHAPPDREGLHDNRLALDLFRKNVIYPVQGEVYSNEYQE